MVRFKQCRAITLVDERYGNGTARMFEGGEIIPFFMYTRDETIGFVRSSMLGRFRLREYVWAVVSGKLRVCVCERESRNESKRVIDGKQGGKSTTSAPM